MRFAAVRAYLGDELRASSADSDKQSMMSCERKTGYFELFPQYSHEERHKTRGASAGENAAEPLKVVEPKYLGSTFSVLGCLSEAEVLCCLS